MADDKKMYFKNKAENIFIDDNTNVKTALDDKASKNHTHRTVLSLVPTGTNILQNADLNTIDYIKVGCYYCGDNNTASTFKNCPTNVAFMMEVYSPISKNYDNESTSKWTFRIRKIMTYDGHMFFQMVDSGATAGVFTYHPWYKIYSEYDKPSIGNGTIKIKQNGNDKGVFTVNQSGNTTIDLGTVLTGGKQTTTSSEDGGSNIYTFSDNSTITIKNGSKGSPGKNGTSAAWFAGTVVTGTATTATSFTVSGSKAGDMYLNTSTYNVYKASAANSWIYVCNIKGAKGDPGTNGITPTIKTAAGANINTVGVPTVTATTSGTTTTFTFDKLKGSKGDKGDKGDPGTNGTSATWFTGTQVTGTSTTPASFTVSGSKVGDMYINTSTYNVYKASAANSWIYVCNIKGAKGDKGDPGTNGTSAAWFVGTTVTGTSTTPVSFTVSGSKVGDMYLNTSTYNVYKAVMVNSWVYYCNIKGAKGDKGDKGVNATTTATGTATTAGLTKLYASTGTNTDGTITQAALKSALDGKSPTSHKHTKSEITDMPTTLPNPSSLVIHTVNGSGQVSSTVYDGSESKAIAITSSAIGAALSNEVYKIKEITKATDWNTLTDTGIYHIKTTECTNCPITNHGTLYTNGSITTIFQMFIPDIGKVIYKRYKSGEWSSWAPIQAANPNSLVVKLNSGSTEGSNMFTYNGTNAKSINITPNSIGAAFKNHSHLDMNMVLNKKLTSSSEKPIDLNYQYYSGMKTSYVIDAGQYANGPAECTGKIDLFLLDSDGSQHKQIVTDFDTGYVYQRSKTGDSWSEWQLLNDPIIALPSACDLNDYYYKEWGTMRKYHGLFGSNSGNSISNSPSNNFTGSAGFINDTYLWTFPAYVFTGSKTLATVQILNVNGFFYKRIRYSMNNSWTSWDEILTKSQIQNLTPDSGWKNVTLGSGFSAYNSSSTPKIRKIGNIVELRGTVKNTNAFTSNGSVLNGIPSNMRPYQTVYVVQTANYHNIQMLIKTDGTVGLERCGSGTVAESAWITVCATWFVG